MNIIKVNEHNKSKFNTNELTLLQGKHFSINMCKNQQNLSKDNITTILTEPYISNFPLEMVVVFPKF